MSSINHISNGQSLHTRIYIYVSLAFVAVRSLAFHAAVISIDSYSFGPLSTKLTVQPILRLRHFTRFDGNYDILLLSE